jgi:hypothetical protein
MTPVLLEHAAKKWKPLFLLAHAFLGFYGADRVGGRETRPYTHGHKE